MKHKSYIIAGLLIATSGVIWSAAVKNVTTSVGAIPPEYALANISTPFSDFLKETAEVNQPVVSYETRIEYEESIIEAVEKVGPSVVSITISKNVPILQECSVDLGIPPEFQDFFGNQFEITQPCEQGTEFRSVGSGSGFIVSADGLIATNRHVVSETGASYTVFLADGREYSATVLATSPVQDLAVLKINATNLPAVTLGNSDTLRAGQTAIAIGNPLGEFENTVSVGVVSGLSRNIVASDVTSSERLEGLIQTDAAINPGNSGGPLVNLRGEVIGINTATVSDADGIGFAIPINAAKRDIRNVIQTGQILTPFIGVRFLTITEDVAERQNLPVTYGALVQTGPDGVAVVPNSPASRAGLIEGDIILEVNNVRLTSNRSLLSRIQDFNVGDTVSLKVLRNGEEITTQILLEARGER